MDDAVPSPAPASPPLAVLAEVESKLSALEHVVSEVEPVAERIIAILGKLSPVMSRAEALLSLFRHR